MASVTQGKETGSAKAWPTVNPLTPTDVLDALDEGIRDFRAAPKYGLFFGAFYAAAGWLLISLVYYLNHPYLAYPMATGFALFAPFAVTGLYDVSRRLEQGELSGVLDGAELLDEP